MSEPIRFADCVEVIREFIHEDKRLWVIAYAASFYIVVALGLHP